MRLVCPNCEARYEVPDDAIPDAGRDVQCASCGHAWYQMRARAAGAASVGAGAAAAFSSVVAAEAVPGTADADLPVSSPAAGSGTESVSDQSAGNESAGDQSADAESGDAGPAMDAPPAEPFDVLTEAATFASVAPVQDGDTLLAGDAALVALSVSDVPEAVVSDELDSVLSSAEADQTFEPDVLPTSNPDKIFDGAMLEAAGLDGAVIDGAVLTGGAGPLDEITPDPAPELVSDMAPDMAVMSDVLPESAQPDAAQPDAAQPETGVPLAATGAAAYAVDESVLAILREEAEREATARRADAQALETQTDLGLSAGSKKKIVAKAEPKPSARRDLLPDVEEINSTLRPSEPDADAIASGAGGALSSPARRGFRSGFLAVMTAAILGAALYILAPRLGSMMPALADPLQAYVGFVDSLRLHLDGMMRSATVAINGG